MRYPVADLDVTDSLRMLLTSHISSLSDTQADRYGALWKADPILLRDEHMLTYHELTYSEATSPSLRSSSNRFFVYISEIVHCER